MLGQIDGAGGFAMAKGQVRAELVGERPHRIILRTGGDAQAVIAFRPGFRDQLPEQDDADPLPTQMGFDTEGDFRQVIGRGIRRMQFGCATNDAIFDIGDDDRAILGAFGGVAVASKIKHSVAAQVALKPIVSLKTPERMYMRNWLDIA